MDNEKKHIEDEYNIHIPRILWRYENAELINVYKARFIFYMCLGAITSLLIMTIVGLSIRIITRSSIYFISPLVWIELGTLVVFLCTMFVLVKGYLLLASNLFIITCLVNLWSIIVLSQSRTISLLDTIVLIFAALSVTPLVVRNSSRMLALYTLVNIPILWIFMYFRKSTLVITQAEFYDYLMDNTLGFCLLFIVTINIFKINRSVFLRLKDDIRKRKSAEQALIRSNSEVSALLRFQNEMLDTAATWINTLDARGNIIWWNRAAERISGYSKEEVTGNNKIWEWLYPDKDYRNMVYARAADIISSGKRVENLETTIRTKDGRERIISWNSNNLVDEKGEPVGSIALGADVTDSKREQLEKERLEEQMLQMQKMESIGRLAGGIAHDFNNLLTAILGSTELGMRHTVPGEKAYGNFITIRKAAESAANMTRQLLSFSRKQVIEPRIIDLNVMIEHVRGMLERMIGENILLITKPFQGLHRIRADQGLLEQIFVNLAVNSRDAMDEGGVLTLETSNIELDESYMRYHANARPGSYVMLAVGDTGRGMSSDVREHIFEPFFTTKEIGKGTGMGLATVYGAVKQSGGMIDCYSEEGHGTTFKIYFPAVLEDGELVHVEPEEYESPAGTETILVVEDNPHVLEFVSESLASMGYNVLTAMSGEHALRVSQDYNGTIEMMMTDVILTGISGTALAGKMKEIRPGIRVLYNSGYSGDLISRSGVIEEGIHFIGKPFTASALARKIRSILDAE